MNVGYFGNAISEIGRLPGHGMTTTFPTNETPRPLKPLPTSEIHVKMVMDDHVSAVIAALRAELEDMRSRIADLERKAFGRHMVFLSSSRQKSPG